MYAHPMNAETKLTNPYLGGYPKTADFEPSADTINDFVIRSIEGLPATVHKQKWNVFPQDLEDQETYSAVPAWSSAVQMKISPAAIVMKMAEDWKNENDPGYILNRLESSIEIKHGKRIARRISELRRMVWEDGDDDITASSLQSFHEFMTLHPNVVYPDISLTPDNDVYARWKGPDHFLCGVHFVQESRVRYVVFAPDRKRKNITDRITGTGSVESFFEALDRAYDVARWVIE